MRKDTNKDFRDRQIMSVFQTSSNESQKNELPSNPGEERYMKVIRYGAAGVSVFLWLLSVMWSADGFGIKVEDWKWAGYGLAASVTVVQLVFNRGTMNPTLFFGGIAAYLYGIATNVLGLMSVMGFSANSGAWKADPLDSLFSTFLIIALAFVVEVLPESLLLWAVSPDKGSKGDFISSLFNRPEIQKFGNRTPNKPTNRIERTEPNRTVERTEQTKQNKPFPYPVNWGKLDKNTNIYRIVLFYREYYAKHGKECPNSLVEEQTKIGKSQVSSVLKKLKDGEFA